MTIGDYQVERLGLVDLDGKPVGLVVCKQTYQIGQDGILRLADEQEPVLFADKFVEGEDQNESPPLFENDVALLKTRSDFVVYGTAYAPGGEPSHAFECQVVVGKHKKSLLVLGPRRAIYRPPKKQTAKETVYTPPLFTEPTPVRTVAIDYRNAYGGKAIYKVPNSDEVLEIPCPTNPMGKGYCVQNSPEGLDGLELPQVEDPENRLTPENLVQELGSPEEVPIPAGFGVYPASWYPRSSFVGVMPHEVEKVKQQMKEQAAQMDPEKDGTAIQMLEEFDPPIMDPRFYQCAAPGLALPFLNGDESVALINMTPNGLLTFNLPGKRPLVNVDRGDGPRDYPAPLDTVYVLPDERKLVLVFRARVPLADESQAEAFSGCPLKIETLDTAEYHQRTARLELYLPELPPQAE